MDINLNYKAIIKILGMLFLVIGFSLILPIIVGVYYGETNSIFAFTSIALPLILIGTIIVKLLVTPSKNLMIRDGIVIVSTAWILAAILGSLPFIISGAITSPIDAFFETCSGFSTTGASILNDIESMPKSILFWRSFTHWLGGMGILVFAVALLPKLGINGKTIIQNETPGPILTKLTPRISDTARWLYYLYGAFTLIETIMLKLGGLSFFDAITHSFATLGTGGFSTYNDSIAHFTSPYIQLTITVFMLLSGINFNLYFILAQSGLKNIWKDSEFKAYILIIAITTAMLTIYLYFMHSYDTFFDSFLASFFQEVSIMTTTGFGTSDYTLWPTFAQMILFLLFFCGASSSSTGGGVKVVRIVILFKLIKRSISLKIHPNAVVQVKIDNQVLPRSVVSNAANFLFLYIGIVVFGALLISIDGHSMITNFTASASALGNIGPGFAEIGPTNNYSIFSDFSKFVLSVEMIAGRLELFTLIMLFSKKFWNPCK